MQHIGIYMSLCMLFGAGRGRVAEMAQMYPRVSQGNVKCCLGIPHTECAYTHICLSTRRSSPAFAGRRLCAGSSSVLCPNAKTGFDVA